MNFDFQENKEISFQITRNLSWIFKGLAIILMIMHHFCFSQFAISVGGYQINDILAMFLYRFTRLCVPIFAFLTGYRIALSNVTIVSTLTRIFHLYVTYWIVYIPLVMLVDFRGGDTMRHILLEAFALDRRVMTFCWYVPFYAISQILICLTKNYWYTDKISIVKIIIIPIAIFTILERISKNNEILVDIFSHLKHYLPCIMVGVICKQHKILEKLEIMRENFHINRSLLLIILCCTIAILRYKFTSLDFIYGALFIFAVLPFVQDIKNKSLRFLLTSLGKVSSNMWYLQCTVTAPIIGDFIQKIVYPTNSIVVNFIILLIVLFNAALLLTKLDAVVFNMIRQECN